jgi:mannosyl-oligosaccharide glucosidase
MSWIFFFSDGLETIATYLNSSKPAAYYGRKKEEMRKKILDECLDPVDLLFKDQIVKAKNEYVDALVSKVGYINLFPFFTGVLDDKQYEDEHMKEHVMLVRKKLVEIMMDPDLLMSEDGLRSLSFSDPLYGTLDNYWRGAVWMPINYLVLRACRKFYWQDESVRKLYSTLRSRLIETVKHNWESTGYLFENYHSGKGNRGFPFYGWSSLIAQIITEHY